MSEKYKEWKGDNRRGSFSIDEIKEAIVKSTKVVNWYPYHYEQKEGFGATVRGPNSRWLYVSEGYQTRESSSLASPNDDADYAAMAMNSLPFLVEKIEELESQLLVEKEKTNKLENQWRELLLSKNSIIKKLLDKIIEKEVMG